MSGLQPNGGLFHIFRSRRRECQDHFFCNMLREDHLPIEIGVWPSIIEYHQSARLLFLVWVTNQVAVDLIDASQNEDVHGSQLTSAEIVDQSRLSPTQQKSVL
jgi:hypothetical protein